MTHEIDITFLDKTEISQQLFPKAFSISLESFPQSDNTSDNYFIDVDENVMICCKFYVGDNNYPTVLYFHGNGETASDQNAFAYNYLNNNINLFVTDYRGYGVSDGVPSMSNMFSDCHSIYKRFKQIIADGEYNPDIYLLGRSLGSLPALELAYHYQDELKGIIIESGSAQNFSSLWKNADPAEVEKLKGTKFYNYEKIKEITIPTLVIHGELDNMIPVKIGHAMYELSGASDKDMAIIPGASHNDLIEKGRDQYFAAVKKFVK